MSEPRLALAERLVEAGPRPHTPGSVPHGGKILTLASFIVGLGFAVLLSTSSDAGPELADQEDSTNMAVWQPPVRAGAFSKLPLVPPSRPFLQPAAVVPNFSPMGAIPSLPMIRAEPARHFLTVRAESEEAPTPPTEAVAEAEAPAPDEAPAPAAPAGEDTSRRNLLAGGAAVALLGGGAVLKGGGPAPAPKSAPAPKPAPAPPAAKSGEMPTPKAKPVEVAETSNVEVANPVEVKLPSGIKYTETTIGGGGKVGKGDAVAAYVVATVDGKVLFDTGKRKLVFLLGQPSEPITYGVEEAIEGMRQGGKRTIVVPPKVAFADQRSMVGAIPKSAITYEFELLRGDALSKK
jgi:peptidylprolyl isomerase